MPGKRAGEASPRLGGLPLASGADFHAHGIKVTAT